MAVFYFTYGTDETFPFYGGWTEIEADDETQARELFRVIHPHPSKTNTLNCAFVYTEHDYQMSKQDEGSMFNVGNFGNKCWEKVSILREYMDTETTPLTQFQMESLNRTPECGRNREDRIYRICRESVIATILDHATNTQKYDLDDEEWEALYDTMINDPQFLGCSDVVQKFLDSEDFFEDYVDPIVETIIAERNHIYRIPVYLSTTTNIYVRAKNEDEAYATVRGMADFEIFDGMDESDFDYEIDPYGDGEEIDEDDAQFETIIDAD